MRISNIRLGHATNSSSTHSIVISPKGMHDRNANGSYGWNRFVCGSKTAKTDYLSVLLYTTLVEDMGEDIACSVAKDWMNIKGPGKDDYIDHQSFMSLPRELGKKGPSKTFFLELVEYFMQEKIAIVGGNDNDNDGEPSADIHFPLPTDTNDPHICRKDGYWWTLYNQKTGVKIRLSFKDKPNPSEYVKSTVPELVDFKITDKCHYQCHYCYQSSTPDGQHADMNNIHTLIYNLQDIGVFEVAIGGGDPLEHPDFVKILKAFRDHDIVPNFSTRSTEWMHDEKIVQAVKDYCGKFAISVSDESVVKYTVGAARFLGIADQLAFHYVMGLDSLDYLERILKVLNSHSNPLVLLGFKDVGRGANYKKKGYLNWLNLVEKYPYVTIGIDSVLAEQSKLALENSEISKKLVTYQESAFSMYVDAVELTAAKSSFSPESWSIVDKNPAGRPWKSSTDSKEQILKVFNR